MSKTYIHKQKQRYYLSLFPNSNAEYTALHGCLLPLYSVRLFLYFRRQNNDFPKYKYTKYRVLDKEFKRHLTTFGLY